MPHQTQSQITKVSVVRNPNNYVNFGAEPTDQGTIFSLFSQNATKVELCIFDSNGDTETERLGLLREEAGIWSGLIPQLSAGTIYGYRVHGPYQPQEGLRFNPNKLLLDPYATQIHGDLIWNDSLYGYKIGSDDLSFDERDSAAFMPKAVVRDIVFDWDEDKTIQTPWSSTFIYEAHVKGATMLHPRVEDRIRGKFEGLASDALLEHLTKIGVTAIELLPIHYFISDRQLLEKNLSNYWGYQTLGFFAPHAAYLTSGKISGFKSMVRKFHRAGIEVIMDVVFNHTAEGNEKGPTLSFKGIDNATYYKLVSDNKRHYFDETGTGNTLNVSDPMVLRMVLDSLRYWVESMHVDGFRFDLASTLGREDWGFDRDGSFFDAIRQDPVLRSVKLIAEPWDVGEGGYQVGGFPSPFREWNDKFRDRVRNYWRGGQNVGQGMIESLLGSPVQFNHDQRPATSSVNFISAHDGFTAKDVVSFNEKHNQANGEDGNDGHNNNVSDNLGAEGHTDNPEIVAARNLRLSNMMATVFLSKGVPMILSGDEIGNSQNGNNNVYCQDNEIAWVKWEQGDKQLIEFVAQVSKFRKKHNVLISPQFLIAERSNDAPQIIWYSVQGQIMTDVDWENSNHEALAYLLKDSVSDGKPVNSLYVVVNNGTELEFTLPESSEPWKVVLCTSDNPVDLQNGKFRIGGSIVVFERISDELAI